MMRATLQSMFSLAEHVQHAENCGPDCFCWAMRQDLSDTLGAIDKTTKWRTGQWYYAPQ